MKDPLIITKFLVIGILYIVALYVTIYGLLKLRVIGIYSIFIIITGSAFIQSILADILKSLLRPDVGALIHEKTMSIYIIIELFIISFFFYKKISSKVLKNFILLFNGSLFLALCIACLIRGEIISEYYSEIAAIEALIILINCILLFVQILNDESDLPLLKSPDFIITAGIFFFFSFTCPFYMLYKYLSTNNILLINSFYTVNNIGYVVLFISFLKAYQCQIRLNKS